MERRASRGRADHARQLGGGRAGAPALVLRRRGDRQDVNQTLIQPFVNYNLPGGWYAVSAPIITANWEADSDDTWTVPVGGGMGRIFHIGGQAMNASAQAFYNVESPQYGPDWSIRLQLQFLFPK